MNKKNNTRNTWNGIKKGKEMTISITKLLQKHNMFPDEDNNIRLHSKEFTDTIIKLPNNYNFKKMPAKSRESLLAALRTIYEKLNLDEYAIGIYQNKNPGKLPLAKAIQEAKERHGRIKSFLDEAKKVYGKQ